MPDAVAVPCVAAVATATLVAAPPPRLNVMVLLLLLYATVALTALTVGVCGVTVIDTVVAVCGTAPDYDLEGRNDVRACQRNTRLLASAEAEQVVADAARARPIRITTRAK